MGGRVGGAASAVRSMHPSGTSPGGGSKKAASSGGTTGAGERAGCWPSRFRGACVCLVCHISYAYRRGGRVLLTEIPLPRIARQGAGCLLSIRGQARKARIERFELDEGFQPYHPPVRCLFVLFLSSAPGACGASHRGTTSCTKKRVTACCAKAWLLVASKNSCCFRT